ncbi:hypothetical protein VTJ49DRAFT_6673 [Mycothermus thermophilus]|uniref:Uncharacterized protein n=1 Tax=Humicola insolens TaxID=85995 RepID=A0ABR3V157_HUMIN
MSFSIAKSSTPRDDLAVLRKQQPSIFPSDYTVSYSAFSKKRSGYSAFSKKCSGYSAFFKNSAFLEIYEPIS